MGLDVYLHKCPAAVVAAHAAKREADPDWDEDDEEREEERIERDSATYPEHMFKIGYFRSSYNSGGIQSVMNSMIGVRPLDYIFEAKRDEYRVRPDWIEAANRCEDGRQKWAKHITTLPFQVECVSENPFDTRSTPPSNAQMVMDIFRTEYQKYTDRKEGENPFGFSYSNRDGEFSLETPVEVHAMIRGTTRNFLTGKQEQCTYIVKKMTDHEWYTQALEIVQETIEWVLAQEDPQDYLLHWSG